MAVNRLLGATYACIMTLGFSNLSEAVFMGRLPATPGGADYQAYYDDQLDITWAANANINGYASWDEQMAWVAGLTINGISGWRLPNIGPYCYGSLAVTQEDCKANEYGHLYYYGAGTTYGDGVSFSKPDPFTNIQDFFYYTRSEVVISAWTFHMENGIQSLFGKSPGRPAWAVHDGDVSNLPIPASGWRVMDFLTLCAASTVCTPTRSIEFDSSGNLYVEDTTDDGSGQIEILKIDVASDYSTSSIFTSYSTSYKGVTGLDFDDLGNMYVSERSVDGDSGIIRKIDVSTMTYSGDVMAFSNHRPTGIDADLAGNVYYSARKESDGKWGKIFKIDPTLNRSELSSNTVATGIALDAFGNIFITTPNRTDLPLQNDSIYMFRASDTEFLNPILIVSSTQRGGELTFDDDGNLYMIAEDQVTIIKFSPLDSDEDGILDYMDNCTLIVNPDQRDTDDDGYGSICDPDFDNNGVVQAADLAYLKSKFFMADEHADLDGNGVVQAADLAVLKAMFFQAPGPSGLVP